MAEQSLKDKTAKGLFWGGISNGIQQLLSLVFGICLARMLSQTDYGMFTMLIIFTTAANLLLDSGFTTALINKKDATDKDYNSVFWFSTGMGVFLYILLFLAAPYIAVWLGVPSLTTPARFMFLWFLFGSTGTVHNALLVKNLMIKEKAKIEISAFVLSGMVAVGMAWQGMAYWSLFVQMVLQGFIGTLLRWYYSPWRPSFRFDSQPLKQMFPFSAKLLITGLFNVVNNNIFGPLIGKYYSPKAAGDYGQGYKWSYVGYSVVWGMVNNVSQPVLAQLSNNPGRQEQAFRKMVRFVSFLVFPCMLGLAFVSHEFIFITVTDKWAASIPYMQLFCIWGAITPINNLCANVIVSHGKSNIFMYSTITLDIIQLAVVFLSYPYGLVQMVINYIIVNLFWFFVWYYFVRRCIPIRLFNLVCRDIFPFLFAALGAIAIAYFITLNIENIYLRLGIKMVIVASLYTGVLYLCKAVVLKESIQYLKKQFQ